MKNFKHFLLLAALVAPMAQAQVARMVSDFATLSNQRQHFDASLVLDGRATAFSWQERTTSFTADGDITTFVAYAGDRLVGTLSVKGDEVYGEVSVKGKTYTLGTDAAGALTAVSLGEECHCAACGGAIGEVPLPHGVAHNHAPHAMQRAAAGGDTELIHNNDVLRRYRLALLIDYWAYPGNKAGAEAFMASLEAFLNEIYYRDFGICFELVKDDNLIRDTRDKAVFLETDNGMDILTSSRSEFNKIIAEEDYDLGFVIHPMKYETGVGVGWAYVDYAYIMRGRTQGVAINSTRTVAHELGHMFGANHTFIEEGSYQTELGNGQSLMGTEKATPRNFISLVTLQEMRQSVSDNNLYYTDSERTRVVTLDGSEKAAADLTEAEKKINIVNGVKTYNNAPVIDTSQLQRTYVVPPGAYLQFNIPATDADGDALTYTVQQADIYNGSAAHFRTMQGGDNACVMLRKDYYDGALLEYTDHKTEAGKSYTFWLAASDAKRYNAGDFDLNPHATAYDVYETKVEVKGSAEFAVKQYSPNIVSSCYEGYKVSLNWTADTEVFDEESRFRILFSQDGGATYDCVLKDNIRALDNTCDIYIPYGIGTDYYAYRNGMRVYKCLLKLEHVGGVAMTEFPATSTTMGFYISGTRVTFDGLPTERYVEATRDNLPPVPDVTANNNNGAAVNFTERESEDGRYIFRIWETTYNNKTYGFEQIIKIIDADAPAPTEENITLATEYDTYSSPHALDFTHSDLEAYVVASCEANAVVLVRVDEADGEVGLVLCGEVGSTYAIPVGESHDGTTNMLVGTTTDVILPPTSGDMTNFVLSDGPYGVGFYAVEYSGAMLTVGDAYLQIPTEEVNSNNFYALMIDGNVVSGIDFVRVDDEDGVWYDLQGRPVSQPRNGLFIRNGQKRVFK